MSTSKKALETSIYWQKLVLKQSTNLEQKERCRAAIASLKAQLIQLIKTI